jgi:UDP-N-acetylglucosamine diphosphorylase/glucosamine-1-phosphate N-acetyltransferase
MESGKAKIDKINDVQVLILAAGKSTRMKSEEPKALAVLKGKHFLRHILDTLATLELPIKPVIVVGHKRERVKEVIGREHNYAHQEEQLGTGHAVLSAKDVLHPDYKTLLVLSTDQPLVSKETIKKIVNHHNTNKATITLGTVVLPDFHEWRAGLKHFGRIIRSAKGEVEKIIEFKDATDEEKEIKEVNPAIYAFDANWLWKNIDNIRNENAQKEYYITDLIKMAFSQNQKVEAVPVHNIIEGLQPNSPEELETLENVLH